MLGLLPRGTAYLLVVAVLVFLGVQYVPIYFNAFQFNNSVRQEVKFAGSARKTVESVREALLSRAREFKVPVTEEDIKVSRDGPFFIVNINYSVPVNLRVYQHEIQFSSSFSGATFQE